MRRPTTHRFKFPRGTKRSLRSRFLSCSVVVLNLCLQAILLYLYLGIFKSITYINHFRGSVTSATRRLEYLFYCTSRKPVLLTFS